jgi:hypothetical protein
MVCGDWPHFANRSPISHPSSTFAGVRAASGSDELRRVVMDPLLAPDGGIDA